MCSGGLIEREGPRNSRLQHALRGEIENLIGPEADAVDLVPQVTEIDAEDALVGVHQRYGIELQPRRARQRPHDPDQTPLLAGGGRRHAEYAEPPGRREQAIAFLERL